MALGKKINLTFIHFDLEENILNRGCNDFLMIDSSSAHCGKTTKMWSMISSSNMMTVRFQSNEILTKKGFLAVWKTLEEPPVIDCGNCVFPFVFRFRLFDTCTSIDGDQPWCLPGPPVDEGTHMFSEDSKIYCSINDPLCLGVSTETTPQMSPHPNNAQGNCCKY